MKRILLIEDNDLIRESTAEILELTGYQVQTAENGKIGVEKALAQKPDLVICDIMMPQLDGYGVLHIFNTNPKLAGVPFIFLTAKTESADIRKGMELGADDYLTKPFSESQLLRAIEGRFNRFVHLNTGSDASSPAGSDEPDCLQSLLTSRKVHFVRRKRYVYTEGNAPAHLFFLKSGLIKIVRINVDQKEFITDVHKPGDFFGYTALLGNWNYTDSAETLEDSEVIHIPSAEFRQLLATNQSAGGQIIRLLIDRAEERDRQLVSMAYNSLRRRVADKLVELNDAQPQGIIPFTRDDLASLVGTATESLIRILSEFRQDGILETLSSGGIRLVQPEKLHRSNW